MISVGEASARILRKIHPLDAATVPLERAAGRVLAESVVANTTSPPWDNSSMDGYAVRSSDLVTGRNSSPTSASTVDTARHQLKVVAADEKLTYGAMDHREPKGSVFFHAKT